MWEKPEPAHSMRFSQQWRRLNHDVQLGERNFVRRYASREEPIFEQYYGQWAASLRFTLHQLWFMFTAFLTVLFSVTTLFVSGFGIAAWAALYYTNNVADMPISLISVAIVIPISFGISFNYLRRESVLRDVGQIKSGTLLVYYLCRDIPRPSREHNVALQELKGGLTILLIAIRQHMVHAAADTSQVYRAFDNVEVHLSNVATVEEGFALTAAYSRIQQVFQGVMDSFERALVLHDYRTPSSLRAYGFIFLGLNSAIFAPLFAKYSVDHGLWAGIYCCLVSSICFSALYRILLNEEDPFDGFGPDDLSLEPVSMHSAYMYDPAEAGHHVALFERTGSHVWSRTSLSDISQAAQVDDAHDAFVQIEK